MRYETLRDLLDAKGISWTYYSPPSPGGTGAIWNAFDAIEAVRDGPEWRTNVAPTRNFFYDVTNQRLPAMSWIVPDLLDSDHPGTVSDTGPSWVASIVNAVGAESVLELDRGHRRLGRLGRILRSRAAAVPRPMGRLRLPRADAGRGSIR